MDQRAEVHQAVELVQISFGSSREITPHELIDGLIAHFKCSSEHARELIFEAVDLGMLRLTPSYTIITI